MTERQLRLFPHSKPLLERFGRDFFSTVPKAPGVYVMTSRAGQILYIGQSKNLRVRLGNYRNANPEHLPRRIVRLVHLVDSITWEECGTARLAKVRENQLLRLHRPRFNRMNTYPQAYCFLGFHRVGSCLDLHWTRRSEDKTELYGAFKSGAIYAYLALLRLFWSAAFSPASPHKYPRSLLVGRAPSRFSIDLRAGNWTDLELVEAILRQFFRGESDRLVCWLDAAIPSHHLTLFHHKMVAADLQIIKAFYENGPRRLHRLRREHGVEEMVVPKDHLDDLIALSQSKAPVTESLPSVR